MTTSHRHEPVPTLDELISEHATPVLAYVTTIVRDHHAAEDVVQETMLRAWQHADDLHAGRGSVRGWMLTVARHLALDLLRSARSRHERLSGEGMPVPADDGRHPDPADALATRDEVVTLLSQLPAAQRDVLASSYLLDMDVETTARTLGLAPGTVKSRRHYALRELRRRRLTYGGPALEDSPLSA